MDIPIANIEENYASDNEIPEIFRSGYRPIKSKVGESSGTRRISRVNRESDSNSNLFSYKGKGKEREM